MGDYARQAMRLGVLDYLLKPVGIQEMPALMSKAGETCKARPGIIMVTLQTI